MNSPAWIIGSANQILYYSCKFCILSQEDLFCVGGQGNNVANSLYSFFVCIWLTITPAFSICILPLCPRYVLSSARSQAGNVTKECLSVCPVWMVHVDCAWMSFLPWHTVITLHLSVLFSMATTPQDPLFQRCFHCSVHHWTSFFILFFLREQAITLSTCPWIQKAWLTVTHIAVLYLSLTFPWRLCYTIRAKKWGDKQFWD